MMKSIDISSQICCGMESGCKGPLGCVLAILASWHI